MLRAGYFLGVGRTNAITIWMPKPDLDAAGGQVVVNGVGPWRLIDRLPDNKDSFCSLRQQS